MAGPIANMPEESVAWRREAAGYLRERHGIATFDPRGAFDVPKDRLHDHKYLAPVQEINDTAIITADCTLVAMLPGVVSAGTLHEMRLIQAIGTPLAVWAPEGPYGCNYLTITEEFLHTQVIIVNESLLFCALAIHNYLKAAAAVLRIRDEVVGKLESGQVDLDQHEAFIRGTAALAQWHVHHDPTAHRVEPVDLGIDIEE